MNIFLRKYLKLTLYILRKISAIDCEAFIECIKQDSLIKPKINELNYDRAQKQREQEKLQAEKDKADILAFIEANKIQLDLENQNWTGFELRSNGVIPPITFMDEVRKMKLKPVSQIKYEAQVK
jgi:hypothetical protein